MKHRRICIPRRAEIGVGAFQERKLGSRRQAGIAQVQPQLPGPCRRFVIAEDTGTERRFDADRPHLAVVLRMRHLRAQLPDGKLRLRQCR